VPVSRLPQDRHRYRQLLPATRRRIAELDDESTPAASCCSTPAHVKVVKTSTTFRLPISRRTARLRVHRTVVRSRSPATTPTEEERITDCSTSSASTRWTRVLWLKAALPAGYSAYAAGDRRSQEMETNLAAAKALRDISSTAVDRSRIYA